MANTFAQGLKARITDKLVKTLGLQTAVDITPKEISQIIQPVLSVEPEKEVQCDANSNVVTSSTKRTFVMGGWVYGGGSIQVVLKNGKNLKTLNPYHWLNKPLR